MADPAPKNRSRACCRSNWIFFHPASKHSFLTQYKSGEDRVESCPTPLHRAKTQSLSALFRWRQLHNQARRVHESQFWKSSFEVFELLIGLAGHSNRPAKLAVLSMCGRF